MDYEKENEAPNHSPPSEGCPQDGVGNTQIFTSIDSVLIKRKFTANLPADTTLRTRARNLRKRGNIPEVVFWQQVHKGKFYKIDFDRQRIIGRYIVDFYIKGLSLVVEIDGSSHENREDYDKKREEYLKSLGLNVYRINAGDVIYDTDLVLKNLKHYILEKYSFDE